MKKEGTMTDRHYASGNWTVKAGREEEFIARWLEFTGWSKANAPGAREFALLRDQDDPRHFISYGTWDDEASRKAWKNTPEFAKGFGACRDLCDEFSGSDYTLAASPAHV
jgi:heme-degrading monooxygenase HmoA